MKIQIQLQQIENRRILFLQGPIGPFFKNLAKDLNERGAQVYKINFNGGDLLFFSFGATQFKGKMEEFPEFLTRFIREHQIDLILLFGDCRPIHKCVSQVAQDRQVSVGVFEEGYLRPNYITLERFGVNANSAIPKEASFYKNLKSCQDQEVFEVGQPFWYAAFWGVLYYAASIFLTPYFRHYKHHKPLNLWQAFYWLRSLTRKNWYKLTQRNSLKNILTKKYFLVALQVHNDAQIQHHSDFFSVEAFIVETINSFAMHAPQNCDLVIKHHPLDRGFHNYKKLINLMCKENLLVSQRVHYVHDLHLPTLLNNAQGVIVVNSTVGLSAIDHNCPVKVCGRAIYDMEGLTYQGDIASFWSDCEKMNIDKELLFKFKSYLIEHTQINGNFYKKINKANKISGIIWD